MVISGCSAPSKADDVSFVEDTLAHEELFGEPAPQQRTNVLRTVSDVDTLDASAKPSIGVQTNDELADGFAIRFVSGVSIEDDDLAGANLYWTRTIFGADHRVKTGKTETNIPVTRLYDELSNGNSSITIADYNRDNGTNYNYFAVYTVRKINKTNDAKCVINANLVCNGVSSKVLSTTVDQVTKFTFNDTDRGYFGVRKQADGFESFYKEDDSQGNNARFNNIPIEKDESFIIVNRADDWFEIHGYDKTHQADADDNNFGADAMYPFAKAKLSLLSYELFLNTSNAIYSNRAVQFFLVPNDNWHNDNARFAVNVNVDGADKWFSMFQVGEQNLYVCTIPFSNISFGRVIFCRMNPNTTDNNWDNNVRWNQTGNYYWDQATNKFTIQGGEGNNYYGEWSLQAIH